MQARDLATLELPKILKRLSAHAAFSASKELALELTPAGEMDEARRRLKETAEARSLLADLPNLTVGGARDVRPSAASASRGGVLEPPEFLEIQSTLEAARKLRRLLEREGEGYPTLKALLADMHSIPGLIDAISQTFDDRGEIADGASAKLASIRRELQVARDRLTDKLERMVSDPKIQPLLQEAIVTQRDDRFVLPVRAEFKGRLKGVVHDQSSSGATLFIEPLSVVEANNKLRELKLAELEEIRRILAELSAHVGRHADEITAIVEALGRLDLAFAKARYAEVLDASEPALVDFRPRKNSHHPGSTVRLLSARHPLLDPESVVAIDLDLDRETHALVITGPNTGGKTVALKTAGLLALMAYCGLHIPAAPGSTLSLFAGVYADIGDEQSIEQSLSTFSAHISNIIRILGAADERSLVLLDELGAGTDPQEGSALARAILDMLLERSLTALVATHYPELKAYAHLTPGVHNASVEFDLESLRPTYRLSVGLPGRSNALMIAERLGLSDEIIHRARETLTPGDLEAGDLLDEIQRLRDEAREASARAETASSEAEELRARLHERLEGIEAERARILEQTHQNAEDQIESLRKEIRRLRRTLPSAVTPQEAVDDIEAAVEELEHGVAETAGHPEEPALIERSFQAGDQVRVRSLGSTGVIAELGSKEAEVQIGRLRVRARLDDLSPLPGGDAPKAVEARRRPEEPAGAPPSAAHMEVDLRGRTVDEALEALERYLDEAYLAGMPFLRVIHGKGTGRLRQAIRTQLKDNPYVRSFEPGSSSEGGQGVTVVRLAT